MCDMRCKSTGCVRSVGLDKNTHDVEKESRKCDMHLASERIYWVEH